MSLYDSITDQMDRIVIAAANYQIQGFMYTIFNAFDSSHFISEKTEAQTKLVTHLGSYNY